MLETLILFWVIGLCALGCLTLLFMMFKMAKENLEILMHLMILGLGISLFALLLGGTIVSIVDSLY